MSENLSKVEQENIEKRNIDMKTSEVENMESEAAEVVKEVVVKAIREEFSGPIPHPDIMKKYEDILPGATDRIIAMAEIQASHRQAMERKMIEAESRDGLLGVVFAFLLGIGCLAAAIIMVLNVPQAAGVICGAVLGVTGIGAITSNFIRSAKSHGSQKKDKK